MKRIPIVNYSEYAFGGIAAGNSGTRILHWSYVFPGFNSPTPVPRRIKIQSHLNHLVVNHREPIDHIIGFRAAGFFDQIPRSEDGCIGKVEYIDG